ncbi:MAG: hypothetical protein M0019_07670 [Actinomycetota bacterium]|nr:hypothetical protein [Actinomycetota bacterium]
MTSIIFLALLLLFSAMAIAPLIADIPQIRGGKAKNIAKSKHPSAQRSTAGNAQML